MFVVYSYSVQLKKRWTLSTVDLWPCTIIVLDPRHHAHSQDWRRRMTNIRRSRQDWSLASLYLKKTFEQLFFENYSSNFMLEFENNASKFVAWGILENQTKPTWTLERLCSAQFKLNLKSSGCFSSRKNLDFSTVAYFAVIWQLMSNYGLIRLKIFILYKIIIICN